MSTRIVIADDQALFREGLRTLLSTRPDMDVVGEAANGDEVVALVEELRPSVVLMDYLLPRDVITTAARERVTGLAGVPPLWIQLADLEWPEPARESGNS